MNKLKILFLIHNLGPGGAEKVLINLANNMDKDMYEITVQTIFDVGVNKQYLAPHVKYIGGIKHMFRGNIHLMKLLHPRMLHRLLIHENYDVEVAYLEGPSARIISGCKEKDTKKLCWIHCTMHCKKNIASSFRSYSEAVNCYNSMDAMVFVSENVRDSFLEHCDLDTAIYVKYNTNESEKIKQLSLESIEEDSFNISDFKIICVGKITENKGFDRVIRIVKQLTLENYPVHLYILGIGEQLNALKKIVDDLSLHNAVTFLGYQTNPYKYISKADLFVCASYSEGFSTAATEALIVGTPVCTVDVSGMKEMLGENNKYGIVVDNNEEALYQGIKKLLIDKELLAHYKEQAEIRGKAFSTENTVNSVQNMMERLLKY